VVFLTIAQGLLPSTATPRLASMYELLIQNMSLSGCIVVSVIVGSWIYHRSDDTPIPNWIRKLVNCVCCKRKTTNGGTSLNEKNVVHSLDESTNGVTNDVMHISRKLKPPSASLISIYEVFDISYDKP
jgi:hypothetical protein